MPTKRCPEFARRYFPQFDGLVIAARNQGVTIRAENSRSDNIVMPPKGDSFLPARHIPKGAPFLVIVGRREGHTVRTENDGIKTGGMPLDGAGVLTAGHVPELDRLVLTFAPTGRGESLAVPSERHGLDRLVLAVAIEGGDPLATGHFPELDLPVIGTRGQRLAVRAVRHTPGARPGVILACLECAGVRAAGHIPELDPLVSDGGQGLPVRTESHGQGEAAIWLQGEQRVLLFSRKT